MEWIQAAPRPCHHHRFPIRIVRRPPPSGTPPSLEQNIPTSNDSHELALADAAAAVGRLAPGACNEHTSKTCEIDNALNPFGSWLLEKRCKLGSTASLASTTSQH